MGKNSGKLLKACQKTVGDVYDPSKIGPKYMKIEDKLAAFCSAEGLAFTAIAAGKKDECGISFAQTGSADWLFEPKASSVSPLVAKNEPVFIGDHSYINNGGYLRGWVFIGRYCSIGRRVTIGAGMHSTIGISTSPIVKGIPTPNYTLSELETVFGKKPPKKRGKFTVIGNDVWIGDGAVILPGVNVGNGAIIGANTVVTKDVRPYEVVGGAPQTTIKFRLSEEIAQRLNESRWWNYDLAYLKTLPALNILRFLESFDPSGPLANIGTFKFSSE